MDAGPGAPVQLASEDDLLASEKAVAAALAGVEGYDVLMPDCVLDPGVPVGQRGMLRVVVDRLVADGHKVAAVTRNQVIADELARKVHEYGHGAAFLGVAVLDLELAAVADSARWNAAMRSALDGLAVAWRDGSDQRLFRRRGRAHRRRPARRRSRRRGGAAAGGGGMSEACERIMDVLSADAMSLSRLAASGTEVA
ncbi:MAG TPA: hypothetical protein VG674_10425 [Amycolatopsis sp.]|nr:hypothetical protein [Amycolatopsis sp.]